MALEEYKRKRDFKKTLEPPAVFKKSNAGKKSGASYLIQKHDATRLHYDFRLELDGVLLSWAVTKGPSLDPADKRLAVRTEDHPLSYGTFEGTIPQGQYGGGTVMLWDRGSWEPQGDPHAGLKAGNFKFILHGERLRGKWALIRMKNWNESKSGKKSDRENWLLIKEKDDEVRVGSGVDFLDENVTSISTGRLMSQISTKTLAVKKDKKSNIKLDALLNKYPDVQLATLVEAPPTGDNWVHEVKFDGYRLLAFLQDGVVKLRTRNGNDWTNKFPAIEAALEKLKVKSAIFDMEAVVLDKDGKSSFQALQHALGEGGDQNTITAFVFDLLYLDGTDITREPLTIRKKKLAALLKKPTSALQYSEHIIGKGAEMLTRSCTLGLEGIISKQASASYQSGRSKSWLKSKCIKRQEFIIIGYTAARKGNRAIGALHLGYYEGDTMRYAGKVGTGFTMESAHELYGRLTKLETTTKSAVKDFPRPELRAVKWTKPVLLCEVAFTEWTEDGHIRHPSFQGMREDKNAKEVKQEKPLPVEKVTKAKNTVNSKPAQQKKSVTVLTLHGITITHPERVISDAGQITKGELAEYYAAVAPYILPQLVNRLLSVLRCPGGIGDSCFFQRNPGQGLGSDVHPFPWKHKGKNYEYLFIKDEKGLMELVQMNSIELHPWGARTQKIDYPDRLIFDLDPDPSVPFAAVKLAAKDLRQRLENLGLESFLKCTGGKGLHVTVPLAEKDAWPMVKEWCAGVAQSMVRDAPDVYIATMSKAKRNGKIFIDYFRNDYTATAIADYAVRARPGMPVAVPLEWKELDKLKSGNQFTMADVLKRLQKQEPNPDRYKIKQRLPKK